MLPLRVALLGMRLWGVFGCSGWPPRPSTSWICYTRAFIAADFALKFAMIWYFESDVVASGIVDASTTLSPRELTYIVALFTCNAVLKNLGSMLTRVVLVSHTRGLSLLVRAVFLHAHSWPTRHTATRSALIFCLAVSPLAYAVASLSIFFLYSSIEICVHEFFNDLGPSIFLSFTLDSFIYVVSESNDFVSAVADGVQEMVDALAGAGREVSMSRARELRALRLRYQCVLDAVHEANRLYGAFHFIFVTMSLVEGVICLYTGVIMATLGRQVAQKSFGGALWAWLWGALLVTKLLFVCGIGEKIVRENTRIYSTLQTGITNNPDMDSNTKREIIGFIQQINLQEIRFGAFDLFYFDLDTMKRILASVVSYLVVLAQFSAVMSQSEKGLLT